ncbi:RF-1 domain-containing protein [Mycena pura]|uniref:RF-1 domain-containing protein n=1 Tax=Mycena pura TaxID=153505 RepID=A0AAD6YI90_9AGAR|nr:RF-1 domain-containing protein [Mycena pura]
MSITHQLRVSARSTYRQLLRASSFTFLDDEPVLSAFRSKIRQDALTAQNVTDPVVYEQHNALAREIATILRKNVAQANRINDSADSNTWSCVCYTRLTAAFSFCLGVRITEETELGSNDTVKSPPALETRRRARKREKEAQIYSESPAPAREFTQQPRMFYSALKAAHKNRVVPEIKEADLEEAFVRGSGPGGQSVNKTENNVQLLHRPTGIRVSCHETRSLALNRRIARRLLVEKACLDEMQNPGLSKGGLQQAKQRERNRQRRRKAKRKQLAALE